MNKRPQSEPYEFYQNDVSVDSLSEKENSISKNGFVPGNKRNSSLPKRKEIFRPEDPYQKQALCFKVSKTIRGIDGQTLVEQHTRKFPRREIFHDVLIISI